MSSTGENKAEFEGEQGEDNNTPLGKQAPGAPFAVVGLSYLIVLMVLALGICAFVFWFS